MRSRPGPLALLAAAGIALAVDATMHRSLAASVDERGRLLATGSAEHVWWIASDGPSGERTSRLMHGVSAGNVHSSRVAAAQVEPPEGLASRGSRVWIAFRPTNSGERRDVLTLEARRNPATGLHYSAPAQGADVVASLPGGGHLGGFEADDGGPWALIVPGPADRFGVRRDGSRSDAESVGVELLRLVGRRWEAVELPGGAAESLRRGRSLRLAPFGERIGLVVNSERGLRIHRFDPERSPPWKSSEFATAHDERRFGGGSAEILGIVAAGRVALVAVHADGIRLAYARDQELLAWAETPRPRGAFAVLGDDRGAMLLEQVREIVRDGDGSKTVESVRAWRIDPLASEPRPAVTFVQERPLTSRWIHLPLLAMLAVATILGFLFVRELSRARREGDAFAGARMDGDHGLEGLPPPMPIGRRLAALAIDLLPGAAIALALLDARPRDLLQLPSWSVDRAAADPAILMIVVTALHGAIGEALWGRSLGKWAFGGVVVAPDGSPLGAGRALLRGLVKVLVLAAPVLGLVALLSADGRGVQDVISRSMVVDCRVRRNEQG